MSATKGISNWNRCYRNSQSPADQNRKILRTTNKNSRAQRGEKNLRTTNENSRTQRGEKIAYRK